MKKLELYFEVLLRRHRFNL